MRVPISFAQRLFAWRSWSLRLRVALLVSSIIIMTTVFAIAPLVAAITLVVLTASIVLCRPALGIYGAIFCAPLHVYRHAFGPANLSLFRVLVLLLAPVLVAHVLLGTRQVVRRRPSALMSAATICITVYLLLRLQYKVKRPNRAWRDDLRSASVFSGRHACTGLWDCVLGFGPGYGHSRGCPFLCPTSPVGGVSVACW